MLKTPTILRDELAKLANDVGPLHTISAIGFRDADARRVTENLAAVAAERRWTVIDARGVQADDLARQLADAQAELALVILVDAAAKVERPLAVLVKGIIDKRRVVDLLLGVQFKRADRQSVFLVIAGANKIDQAASALYEIPYWKFIGVAE